MCIFGVQSPRCAPAAITPQRHCSPFPHTRHTWTISVLELIHSKRVCISEKSFICFYDPNIKRIWSSLLWVVAVDAFAAQSVFYQLVSCQWHLRVLFISASIMCDLAVSLCLPKIAHFSAGVPNCAHPPNTHLYAQTELHETQTRPKAFAAGINRKSNKWLETYFSSVCICTSDMFDQF